MDSLTVLMFAQLGIPRWSPLDGGGKMARAKSPSTPEEICQTKNRKSSSTKRTHALDIRHFHLIDQIEKGNIKAHCCPANKMVADCRSKPLQGKPFIFLR